MYWIFNPFQIFTLYLCICLYAYLCEHVHIHFLVYVHYIFGYMYTCVCEFDKRASDILELTYKLLGDSWFMMWLLGFKQQPHACNASYQHTTEYLMACVFICEWTLVWNSVRTLDKDAWKGAHGLSLINYLRSSLIFFLDF